MSESGHRASALNTTEDRPKSRSLKPLRALWPYLARYKGTLVLALGALLIASTAMLVLPIAFRNVIDKGMAVSDRATIDLYFGAFLAAAAVFGIFAALRFYLVSWLGERVVADLRNDVYDRVIRMDPTFFEVTRTGEVLSRLTTDTTLVQSIAGVNLSITLRSTIQLVGSLALLIATSPSLAGMIVLLIPVVIVPLILVGRKLRKLSRLAQDRIADTSGLAGETLNAIQTVQAFTLERLHSERYGDAVETSFDVSIRRTRARALLTALGTMAVFGAVTFVLWQGAHRVLAGEMTGGELSQFLMYAVFVAVSAASLSEMWGEVQRAAGAMERLIELRNATPIIVAPAQPLAFPQPTRGDILFDDVSFKYPTRSPSIDSRCTFVRARRSRSSDRPARVRARRFSCCCAFTTRCRDASSSMASISRKQHLKTFDAGSAWYSRRPSYSARRHARTFATVDRMQRTPTSKPQRAPQVPMSSFVSYPTATTPSWASAARAFRADNANASRLRARY
jgi:ATP-binding cassette subfamily B protein